MKNISLPFCVENANQIKMNILKKKHPTISKNICVHFSIYLPLSTVNNQIVKHKSIYELMQRQQVSFLKSSLQWSLRNITFFSLLYFAHIMQPEILKIYPCDNQGTEPLCNFARLQIHLYQFILVQITYITSKKSLLPSQRAAEKQQRNKRVDL